MAERIFTLLKYFQNALSDRFIGLEIFSNPEIKDLIIDLNTKDQLFKKGVDSKNNPLPTYSKFTEILSGGRKKEGEPFTLNDTGEFYRSFVIKVLNSGDAEIIADTIKEDPLTGTSDLLDTASQFILGLTDESKEILRKVFKEKIIEKIRSDLSRI